MKTYVLERKCMGEKCTCHDYLKAMLDLPEYYGSNLDALYDCLCEMQDIELLIIEAGESEDYFEKLMPVLQAVVRENDSFCIRLQNEAH